MVRDSEVLTKVRTPRVRTLLYKAPVRWAGKVARKSDDRLPQELLYGELCEGKSSVGRQKKRCKHILKLSPKSFYAEVTSWETPACDCRLLCSKISAGALAEEKEKLVDLSREKTCRLQRKGYRHFGPGPPTFPFCDLHGERLANPDWPHQLGIFRFTAPIQQTKPSVQNAWNNNNNNNSGSGSSSRLISTNKILQLISNSVFFLS